MLYDPNALAAVKDSPAFQMQPAVKLAGLRRQRLEELRRSLGMAKQTGTMLGATEVDAQQLEQDIASDPDTGLIATANTFYNQPAEIERRETAKQDALQRLLAPKQLEGEYNVAQEQVRGDALVRAAEAQGVSRAELEMMKQEAAMGRTNANVAGRSDVAGANARNRALETQAAHVAKTGPGKYNPLRWLMGQPTGTEQAANLRAQIGGGGADEQSPEGLAQLAFSRNPGMSAGELQRDLVEAGFDPSIAPQVIAAYSQLAGR